MQINIRVTAHARQNKIVDDANGVLRVYTTSAATDGQANSSVIKMLAEHFNVPKTSIKIVRGQTARDKVIEF
ncbi:MAG: DUF167 domain-containing protein [Candidatus Enterousia sp.]